MSEIFTFFRGVRYVGRKHYGNVKGSNSLKKNGVNLASVLSLKKPSGVQNMSKQNPRVLVKVVTLFLLLSGASANAGLIVVSGDTNLSSSPAFYSNLFAGSDVFAEERSGFFVTNTSNSVIAAASFFNFGELSAGALVGKEWFLAGGRAPLNAGDLSIVQSFVDGGGNVLFFGDGNPFYDTENRRVNNWLSLLGSSIRISETSNAAEAVWNSTGSSIAVDSLTAGVSSFSGNFAAAVSGGTPLFSNDANGLAVVVVERLSASEVPTPATLALFGLGLAGLGFARRKA